MADGARPVLLPHRRERLRHGGRIPRLAQQALDPLLRLAVRPLAEVLVAQIAPGVDQVPGRPVVIGEALPGAAVLVEEHRIGDALGPHGCGDQLRIGGEFELRRVDADDDEPAPGVALMPGFEVGQRPQAVDARGLPEIHHHHRTARERDGDWRTLNPPAGGQLGGVEGDGDRRQDFGLYGSDRRARSPGPAAGLQRMVTVRL